MRPALIVSVEGDAPAGRKHAGAHCAPLRNDTSRRRAGSRLRPDCRAESWPRPASLAAARQIHLLAPYGVSAVPLTVIRQMGGNRKASLTLAREARPEGKRLIDKKGKTFGCPLLAREAAAQAANTQ